MGTRLYGGGLDVLDGRAAEAPGARLNERVIAEDALVGTESGCSTAVVAKGAETERVCGL